MRLSYRHLYKYLLVDSKIHRQTFTKLLFLSQNNGIKQKQIETRRKFHQGILYVNGWRASLALLFKTLL